MTATRARRYTLADVRERSLKPRDSWWTVLLVDPVAAPLTLVAAALRLTPNLITLVSLAVGVASAWLFWDGALVAGAIAFHVSFTIDCVDGKLARLTGSGTPFGPWLDYAADRARVLAVTYGLLIGQWRATGEDALVYLAVAVVFADMLRYIDVLQEDRLRRRTLGERADEVHAQVRDAVGWYARLRERLARWRIRPHLFSGVEFQMAVFIVGPLAGAVPETAIVALGLLAVFEVAAVYRLWVTVRAA